MWPLLFICLSDLPQQLPTDPTLITADQHELQAFALADQGAAASSGSADWQLSTELALIRQKRQWQSRLALDSRFSHYSDDQSVYVRWNSRLDGFGGEDNSHAVMSWKELYVGYRWNDSWLTEFGRINQKNGVGRGFNPTDFFAGNAIRAVISQQPAVLREQRLGSLMLRQQWLGATQSVSWLWSPALSSKTDNATFAPDWVRSNAAERWQLSAEQQLAAGWSLGLLAYQTQGIAQDDDVNRHYGLNLSGALNERWLYHLEVASGEQPLWRGSNPAMTSADMTSSRRIATGFNYSLAIPLNVTLEWHYDEAAVSAEQWRQLMASPASWQHYMQQRQGQPATRQALLLQLQSQQWQPGFDWSSLWLHDLQDHSDMLLTELTWNKPEYDIVLQWQWAPGPTRSRFGVVSSQLQLLLRYYI